MAEFTLKARSIFEAVGGAHAEAQGVVFDEAPKRALVSLAARRGAAKALTAALDAAESLTLPGQGQSAEASGLVALALAPGQWFIACADAESDLEARIRAAAGDRGDVTDISDGFVALTLSGRRARDVLARLSTLDYADANFPEGAVARTIMAQIGVVIRRLPDVDEPTYALETARSSARSFAHDVATAISAVAARG
ncbi:hypothetical protein G5B40_12730 [Pikeienuella piscinae]|uniref:Sarcosine oxidase subunit gamma n=1 Tax=Pikeienuella piscinae TaxID=2748098 RepID=A0A7L5C2Y4_9RHOB|nr:sarcosine oxidase subunit gamma family protein [Pikeienuella piscinae]QIE56249.1 hypothetical protein G5B40_12730 [Pikeienuella piscinae]